MRLIGRIIRRILRFARRVVASPPPLETMPNCPGLFKVYRYLASHPTLTREPGGWMYQGRFYPDYLTVGGAAHAIFRKAQKYCIGQGIDVGAGYWPLPGAIPVDIERGPGLERLITDFPDGSLDYVFSSHCLEHIEDWRLALAEWVRKLQSGGILFLYLPHPDCGIFRPGSPIIGDYHKWVPDLKTVSEAIRELGCEIVDRDDGPDAMGSFYLCARKHDNLALYFPLSWLFEPFWATLCWEAYYM